MQTWGGQPQAGTPSYLLFPYSSCPRTTQHRRRRPSHQRPRLGICNNSENRCSTGSWNRLNPPAAGLVLSADLGTRLHDSCSGSGSTTAKLKLLGEQPAELLRGSRARAWLPASPRTGRGWDCLPQGPAVTTHSVATLHTPAGRSLPSPCALEAGPGAPLCRPRPTSSLSARGC